MATKGQGAQQTSLLDVLKKKMRQAKEEAENAKDEADEVKRHLEEEKKKREEVINSDVGRLGFIDIKIAIEIVVILMIEEVFLELD